MPEPDPKPDPEPDPTPDPKKQTKEPDPDPEPYDKDRAMETIRKQRESEKAAKDALATAQAKLKEYEDASKSDAEKLTEGKTAAEKDAAAAKSEAARLRVALRKGLNETQAKRLVGETEDDLEKDADELLASFKQEGDDPDPDPGRRPKERLKPGAVPKAEPDENNPGELAKQVPRGW